MRGRGNDRGQLSLRGSVRGGWRPGAGRKRIPAAARRTVAHRRRASVSPHHPLHVTLRVVDGFPSLRRPRPLRWIRRCIQLAQRDDFRVVHFSVMSNHLHFLVEAGDRRALARGMQGLTIRLARRLNQLFSRGGQFFRERYHARALRDPKQARSALLYVVNNARKHAAERGRGFARGWLDPYSSATTITRWSAAVRSSSVGPAVTVPPKSWLLRTGWSRYGPLDPDAVPAR